MEYRLEVAGIYPGEAYGISAGVASGISLGLLVSSYL